MTHPNRPWQVAFAEHIHAPNRCSHEGGWYRDARDYTWCADCGRWRDDIMDQAAAEEPTPDPDNLCPSPYHLYPHARK